MAKLSDMQQAVLIYTNHHGRITFNEASALGAAGQTLSSLVTKGLLMKGRAMVGNVWTITADGKAAIPEECR
ncbi:hypothetical protein [Burkholderia pseudomallei]|uniref:hypothetical protein n=1 Tax=Burkholderia pseudomallei TaxID=28450 RepID=UPI000A1A294A|nr:hypothetical protein [Burkholderia pseudomallei]ARL38848.1 hypothetical protein BOC49_21575 [Burkholderia pseudomallei]